MKMNLKAWADRIVCDVTDRTRTTDPIPRDVWRSAAIAFWILAVLGWILFAMAKRGAI